MGVGSRLISGHASRRGDYTRIQDTPSSPPRMMSDETPHYYRREAELEK